MENETVKFAFQVPDSCRNDDGSIKEEFYEKLFDLLGKDVGEGLRVTNVDVIEG